MTLMEDIPTKGALKVVSDGFLFLCPGCHTIHKVGKTWQFNGDYDMPTFSPSVLVSYPNESRLDYCCHSFIRDGQIEFLGDCTHEMAGKTLPLDPWED